MQLAQTHENKNHSFAKETSQSQSGGELTFQFVDERSGTAQYRDMQQTANNSPQARQTSQIQAMADQSLTQNDFPVQKKANNTGLPDNLKSGIENLSGYSLDDVKVHRNSGKPAQLQAHAYAQGREIHVAPGQEEHLPHEAWHVVQQKQGRVKPTIQMKQGIPVNDDQGLEQEADVMGAKALSQNNTTTIQKLDHGIAGSSEIAQLKPALGKVIWGVTHAVKEENGSIYGNGKYSDGEIGEWGELTFGEVITVDDADLFMSRRGSNQENQGRRADNEKDRPLIEWTRVLKIKGVNVEGLNVYVRSSTIHIGKGIVDPTARFEKPVISSVHWNDEAMLAGVKLIGAEYAEATKNLPKVDKGRNICSTEQTTQEEEGRDVAEEFTSKESNRNLKDFVLGAGTLVATQGKAFIGVMQIAVDQELQLFDEQDGSESSGSSDKPKEKEKFLYVKWLLGSYSSRGAGVALVRTALEHAIKNKIKKVKVDSAISAVDWYEKRGFRRVGNAQHMNDTNAEREAAQEQDQDEEQDLPIHEHEDEIDCGCVEMELQFYWSDEQL